MHWEGPGDEANCWHTWHRIDTTWRGLLHGSYDCHGLLGSVSMPVFTIYGFSGLIYSNQPLRLAPNRPCMSLVIMPGEMFKTIPINRDICSDHEEFPAAYLDGIITMEWFFLCLHKLDCCGSSDKNASSN